MRRKLLAVGDLHLENFGTWRDEDGRLVWGVNDFDEAATMPYTLDLVRLVTSIQLAPRATRTSITRHAAKAVLKGYREGLDRPATGVAVRGRDLALALCLAGRRRARAFLEQGRRNTQRPRRRQRSGKALIESLPEGTDKKTIRLCRRSARAAAAWGGPVTSRSAIGAAGMCCARPRRWCLRRGTGPTATRQSREIEFPGRANGRYRAPDPLLHVRHQIHLSGASPATPRKSSSAKRPAPNIHLNLLQAMGFDLASIHAASLRSAGAIGKDLKKRPRGWLNAAAAAAADKVRRDFREWNKYMAANERRHSGAMRSIEPGIRVWC